MAKSTIDNAMILNVGNDIPQCNNPNRQTSQTWYFNEGYLQQDKPTLLHGLWSQSSCNVLVRSWHALRRPLVHTHHRSTHPSWWHSHGNRSRWGGDSRWWWGWIGFWFKKSCLVSWEVIPVKISKLISLSVLVLCMLLTLMVLPFLVLSRKKAKGKQRKDTSTTSTTAAPATSKKTTEAAEVTTSSISNNNYSNKSRWSNNLDSSRISNINDETEINKSCCSNNLSSSNVLYFCYLR